MRCFNILDGCFNVIIGGTLLNPACQVHNRDIWCWNSEGHASELSIQLREDFPNSLTLKRNQSAKGIYFRRNMACISLELPLLHQWNSELCFAQHHVHLSNPSSKDHQQSSGWLQNKVLNET
jgi:hypothetical protein